MFAYKFVILAGHNSFGSTLGLHSTLCIVFSIILCSIYL
uniref:Uncharacterized protein n=1 Tax=Arundo donax TaxID=35708 RepID=A0A0A9EDJ1_ARUDO